MSDLLLLVKVQARVATFLAGLTLDRLVDLAEGRLALTVVDDAPDASSHHLAVRVDAPVEVNQRRRSTATPSRSSRAPRPDGGTFDPGATAATLRSCATLDQGIELLASLDLKAESLRALAKALNIPSSGRKADLAKRILNLTLGSRSKHAALRQG
jgi:hypothetical protein